MNTTHQPVATITEILTAKCGTVLQTIKHNAPLIVCERTNLQGFELDTSPGHDGEILDYGTAESVTLTEDGRRYDRESGWHNGPDDGAIYVERWSADGRLFHGWIDSVSRRLVQAG